MKKRREINVFSISFLDLLSGALGAVIILYVAIPKNKVALEFPQPDMEKESLERELKMVKANLTKASAELKELKAKTAEMEEKSKSTEAIPEPVPTPESESKVQGRDLDVGFKFKGKNLVFLVDTSYSMVEEDRMGQVKAGLKMLLTSLSAEYKIEVIQYPLGERAPFRTLFGTVRESSKISKEDAFDFIYRLRPSGGTPTRDALLFALRNYDASDIILLTDGVPTFHNSNKKDDVDDILRVVKEENNRKIQISTIGVGTDFLKDRQSDQYRFLSQLAEQSGGFFVDF